MLQTLRTHILFPFTPRIDVGYNKLCVCVYVWETYPITMTFLSSKRKKYGLKVSNKRTMKINNRTFVQGQQKINCFCLCVGLHNFSQLLFFLLSFFRLLGLKVKMPLLFLNLLVSSTLCFQDVFDLLSSCGRLAHVLRFSFL